MVDFVELSNKRTTGNSVKTTEKLLVELFVPKTFKCYFQEIKKIQVQTILRFSIAGSIEASVLEAITPRKLQQILHSYKHEALQKVKYKLDLIEQPYLD